MRKDEYRASLLEQIKDTYERKIARQESEKEINAREEEKFISAFYRKAESGSPFRSGGG